MDLIQILAQVPNEEMGSVNEDNIRMYLAVGSIGVGILTMVMAALGAGKARASRVIFALLVGVALVTVGLWMFDKVKYLWGL